MIKTKSILSENFVNAVQTAYPLHAEENRPAQKWRQQSRAWWPMAHVGNIQRFRNWNTILAAKLKEIKWLNIDLWKSVISILINCHLHDGIENSNNRILHYKPGVKISTLRISLQLCNDKLDVLLEIYAALCGVPCSMEYSFRQN